MEKIRARKSKGIEDKSEAKGRSETRGGIKAKKR